MDRQTTRQVRFYLRLHYPVTVTAKEGGFCGAYPDLPGCVHTHEDLPSLYAELEQRRREWITARVLEGRPVPLPNAHLESAVAPTTAPLCVTAPQVTQSSLAIAAPAPA